MDLDRMPPELVPNLIEEVFDKFEQVRGCNWTKANRKQFYIELHALFGDVLKRALKIVDEQELIIYKTDRSPTEIAEIRSRRQPAGSVTKLYPNINYCSCSFFLKSVLLVDSGPPTQQNTQQSHSTQKEAYTCEHILALRLASFLQAESLQTVIVPREKFQVLLNQMI